MTPFLASLVLTLHWCDPHDLYPRGWQKIGEELSRTLTPLNLEVRFTKDRASEEQEIRVVLVRSEAAEWGLPPDALGAVLSRSGPQTQVYVFFPGVARVLGYRPEVLAKRWPTSREERDLGRALARVIVHEVMHAVMPSRPHAAEGLTRWKLDRSALLARETEIDSNLAEALRSALLHQLTARSAPSSN